jgi:hypothetical protein
MVRDVADMWHDSKAGGKTHFPRSVLDTSSFVRAIVVSHEIPNRRDETSRGDVIMPLTSPSSHYHCRCLIAQVVCVADYDEHEQSDALLVWPCCCLLQSPLHGRLTSQ